MSDVKEKVEMELKPFETMCDATTEHLRTMICGSCEATADEILTVAKALGEIVDIKKDIVEMCYKKQIMTAMEENEDSFGEEWDENGPMYYTRPRTNDGRYTSSNSRRGRMMYTQPQPMYRMDMDLYRMSPEELRRKDMEMGVHYYTESGNSNMSNGSNSENGMNMNRNNMNRSESRMERAVRHYTENKDMQSLEEMMNAIQEKIMEEAGGMDAGKKNMTKTKLTNLVNMIK